MRPVFFVGSCSMQQGGGDDPKKRKRELHSYVWRLLLRLCVPVFLWGRIPAEYVKTPDMHWLRRVVRSASYMWLWVDKKKEKNVLSIILCHWMITIKEHAVTCFDGSVIYSGSVSGGVCSDRRVHKVLRSSGPLQLPVHLYVHLWRGLCSCWF